MFKVQNSQECTHSFIHMTEPEFVKVNVKQVTVSKVFLHSERLQPYSVKFSGKGNAFIASFKAFIKFLKPQYILFSSFILLPTDFLLWS